MKLTVLFIFLVASLSLTHLQAEVLWPQFRGPNGDGHCEAQNVPTEFHKDGDGQKWRTEIPGKGWSSPVVEGNSIWLTSAVEVEANDEEKAEIMTAQGIPSKKFKQLQVAKHVKLLALEVDRATGEIKREIELTKVETPDSIHGLNSYASPTPFLEASRLYTHFGTFGTFCIDTASGEVLWQARLPLKHGVGPGSSPFVYNDLIVLICDGVDQQYVAALDKNTGKEVWRTQRPPMRSTNGDHHKSYNTPILIEPTDGPPQLVCMGAQWLVSYAPETGEEIWKLDHGSGFSVVPRPVFSDKEQLIYISTGFGKPQLWAITPKGEVVWQEPKRIPSRPSPLLVGDELFVITEGGIATCFDAADGTAHWTERVGGNYSASPILADGHIYVCNQEGKIALLKPGKTYQLVSESDIGEQIMASPIALDGQMIIRSAEALYCFGN